MEIGDSRGLPAAQYSRIHASLLITYTDLGAKNQGDVPGSMAVFFNCQRSGGDHHVLPVV